MWKAGEVQFSYIKDLSMLLQLPATDGSSVFDNLATAQTLLALPEN